VRRVALVGPRYGNCFLRRGDEWRPVVKAYPDGAKPKEPVMKVSKLEDPLEELKLEDVISTMTLMTMSKETRRLLRHWKYCEKQVREAAEMGAAMPPVWQLRLTPWVDNTLVLKPWRRKSKS